MDSMTRLTFTLLFAALVIVPIGRAQDAAQPAPFKKEEIEQLIAPIAIGLGLTLIHLISIPVTNTSVNPARSTGVAVFVGGWAIEQLWMFWVAPIVGALLGAGIHRFIGQEEG